MTKEELWRGQPILNKRGITLIELLVTLVIFAIVVGGIYRVFVAQTRAYTVQDHVIEVQQDIRSAMGIMLRDIRMAGFSAGPFYSSLIADTPVVVEPLGSGSITVNYEYSPPVGAPTLNTVTYAVVGGNLNRTLNGATEPILSNVTSLSFTYGIDRDGDGMMDDINGDGFIDQYDFVTLANVGTARVVAIRAVLTAIPTQDNPDVKTMVSPRTLASAVTLRNVSFRR